MKNGTARLLSVLLAVVTIISAFAGIDFSASAAEAAVAEVTEATEEIEIICVEDIGSSGSASMIVEPSEKKSAAIPMVIMAAQAATEAATKPSQAASTAQPATQKATAKPAPKVGNVKNITKTSISSSYITLKWDKVSDATGYYVYYRNADKGHNYSKIGDIKKNTVKITGVNATTRYDFQIQAYIKQNGKIYKGSKAVKKTATQPADVKNLIKTHSSQTIEMKWSRNSSATGYKIYRFDSGKSKEYKLVKTITNNKTTSYTDKNVTLGKGYYYAVKAYRTITKDFNATYNGKSSIIRFICGLTPVTPTMTSQLSRVSLSWTKNKYATGYDLYYASSKDGKYEKLGTTSKNFWNSKKLTSGKTYYFKIIPYKIHSDKKYKILGTSNVVSKKVTNQAFGHNVGNTYVEISIKQQHLWFYKDGKQLASTDVVTGNDDGRCNTPKGYYTIFQRARNTYLTGPGYSSFVQYWMAFNGGIGIHDASWRSSYGGTIYKGNGSHGCVNTPLKSVKVIYKNTSYGTPVIVF